jgi:hypothetical protein
MIQTIETTDPKTSKAVPTSFCKVIGFLVHLINCTAYPHLFVIYFST